MSDLYWVTGRIEIEPPLNWAQIRAVTADTIFPAALELGYESTETDEGTTVRKYATAIIPDQGERYAAAGLLYAVNSIVERCPNHHYTGYLEMTYADEPSFPERVFVLDTGGARCVSPQLVWPEGSPADR